MRKKSIDKFDIKKNKYIFLERNYFCFQEMYSDLKISIKKKDKSLTTFLFCLSKQPDDEIIKKYEDSYKTTFDGKYIKKISQIEKKFKFFIDGQEKIKKEIYNTFYDEGGNLKFEIDDIVEKMFKDYNQAFEEKRGINQILKENNAKIKENEI